MQTTFFFVFLGTSQVSLHRQLFEGIRTAWIEYYFFHHSHVICSVKLYYLFINTYDKSLCSHYPSGTSVLLAGLIQQWPTALLPSIYFLGTETNLENDVGVTPSSQWASGSSGSPLVQGRLHNDRAHSPPLWLAVAERSYQVRLQRNHGKNGVKGTLWPLFTIAEHSTLETVLKTED